MNKLVEKLNSYNINCETLIILGSGLNEYVESVEIIDSFNIKDIFNIKTDESIGHKGIVYVVKVAGKALYIMSGRLHYYEGTEDYIMRDIIQAFAYSGVKTLIVTNACGGMNLNFQPGDIMLITDHINMSGRNPLVGMNNNDLGPRFVDMSVAYDYEYRQIFKQISLEKHIDIKEGVYVSYLGPSYETPAEIKAFRILGGDAVGMSTVPEVILARHSGMKVLGISIITNLASGLSKSKLNHEEVLQNSRKALKNFSILLNDFLKILK